MRTTICYFVKILIILFCCSTCFGKRNAHHAKKPSPTAPYDARKQLLNVENFGARADGKSDNSQAFKKAWDRACSSSESTTILVPKAKTYYIKHINFTGPCHSPISLEIQGTIKSFPQMYDIPRRLWIKFEDVRKVNVFGGGTIDGNGQVWWRNSCKIKKTKPCQSQGAPTALTFKNCTNLTLRNLKLVNAQQMHVNFQDCNGVEASKLLVVAPQKSPNTDGIHVTRTSNINIMESQIRTGDDCISIVNGSRNVEMRNIVCGPGHGISGSFSSIDWSRSGTGIVKGLPHKKERVCKIINVASALVYIYTSQTIPYNFIGSLGEDKTENYVSNIFVKGATFTGTTNGVRIKTWQGGSGSARNIVFEDILMRNVQNPIIINQYYCDKNKKCDKEKSAVQVENVVYRNIKGTSASKVAINFKCSESVPCKNIALQNVMLTAQQKGQKLEASCSHLSLQPTKLTYFPTCSNNT